MTNLSAGRPRRRWLRLSLRGLMILVVVVGAGLGWVARTVRTQRAAIATVKAAGGWIMLDYHGQTVTYADARGNLVLKNEPIARAWLRRWLGDELFQDVRTVATMPGPVTPEFWAAVANFDRLHDLQLQNVTAVAPVPAALGRLPELRFLHAFGPGLDDQAVAGLAKFTSVRTLNIGESSASDAAFASFAALKRLEDLSLMNCPNLTDDGLARLVAGLPALQRISLTGRTGLTSPIEVLARHRPNLESLQIQGPPIDDDDLAPIPGLTRLKVLQLEGPAITDAGLVHLRSLRGLRWLELNARQVTDVGIQNLSDLPVLDDLSLNHIQLTDAGLEYLSRLPLRQLEIGETCVTDLGMPTLARITTLEVLSLQGVSGLTDAGLSQLRSLTRLEQLDAGSTQVTDAGAAALKSALPKLSRFNTSPKKQGTSHQYPQ